MSAYFITGTDTGVGKTVVACALLQAFAAAGRRTQAIKPVASGCEHTPQGLRNADALALQAAMNTVLPYAQVNPVALEPAIAPHLAAAAAGQPLCVADLAEHCRALMAGHGGLTLVEGAGGWRVPLNDTETLADLARALALPVILVVGLRLGCINHALLTAEAIRRDGLLLAGWVANTVEPALPEGAAIVATLQQRLPAPCLGVLPWLPQPDAAVLAAGLDAGKLP